jgi:hypothetical protein
MYEPHPVTEEPTNPAVKIWRYMDFTKLVSLIDTRCLFFARADRLGDPFEGSYPRSNVVARELAYAGQFQDNKPVLTQLIASLPEMHKQWPRYSAINCWHMNEHESAAMWKLYLKSDEGIAVQSTYERLRESITDEERVLLGVVKYIDYEKDSIGEGNILLPFFHKRKSFEHEREVRGLAIKWPVETGKLDFTRETITQGLQIKINLEQLVERIYIAPSAPEWFADVVRGVIHKYGYEFKVVQSGLDSKPLY